MAANDQKDVAGLTSSFGNQTLNVNARVFVPNFGSQAAPAPAAAAAAPVAAAAPPVVPPSLSSSSQLTSTTSEAIKADPESASTASSSVVSRSGSTAATKSPEDSEVADDWEAANADEDDEEEEVEDDQFEEELSEEAGVGEKPKKKTTGAAATSSAAAAAKPKAKSKSTLNKPEVTHPVKTKEHLNIVFIGHVDAGKSTIGGQLLHLTGMVDKRTLEKYEREAKEKNRESWYLSWALDTNQEERDKGKTVEVGRASFETENRLFTLLDAPGHRGFVPNMIGGASQADLAVLVISARKGEFETGFERGGQTREHAMLAKTAGVRQLIVLINKMDDPTVEWSEARYNECCEKLLPYLKKCGFNPKTELYFMPCSGLTGAYLREPVSAAVCPWFRGKSFLDYLDSVPFGNRFVDGPFRMPVFDKYKDMGTVVMGKVESGKTQRGAQLLLMPNRKMVEVLQLWSDEEEVSQVLSGENVKIKLKGVEEEEVTSGFVLCDPADPCSIGRVFDAQVAILEHKSIICPGYSAVLHIHCASEEISVKGIIDLIDKKTGERQKVKPRFVKQDQVALMRLECSGGMICMEPFSKFQQMGRFTLRDEGKTIAIGKVLRIAPTEGSGGASGGGGGNGGGGGGGSGGGGGGSGGGSSSGANN